MAAAAAPIADHVAIELDESNLSLHEFGNTAYLRNADTGEVKDVEDIGIGELRAIHPE